MGLAELSQHESFSCMLPRPSGGAPPLAIRIVGLTVSFMCLMTDLKAAGLDVLVKDKDGKPVKDVIVFANALSGANVKTEALSGKRNDSSTKGSRATISQINKQFVPYVTAIQVGTSISFPNLDDILHNVYSFSRAKKFELPLYKDEPPEPIVFDKPGMVVLGCNIHDWMVAYVYILETPHFAKTDPNGRTKLAQLAPGEYEVQTRHPRKSRRSSSPPQRIRLEKELVKQIQFELVLKPEWRQRRVRDSK